MPIYEYCCQQCEKDFEVLVRADEQPACPECGSETLEKQFSVPAAHSSGSSDLPICGPAPALGGGCGLPQCGTGGCQGFG